jgi:hypothetical protein
MKLLAIPLLTLLLAPDLLAAEAAALRKVEDKLRTLEENLVHADLAAPAIPWNVLDERESAFWKAVTEAYDFLITRNQTVRHQFLYGAAVAAQSGYPARLEALNTWLKKENNRVYALGLSYAFYDVWKEKVLKINEAVTALGAPRPAAPAKTDARGAVLEMKNFLSELRGELKTAAAGDARATPTGDTPSQASDYGALGLTALVFLGLGLLYPRKKRYVKVRVREPLPVAAAPTFDELPPLPVVPEAPAVLEVRTPAHAVNIEEQCRKIIDDNKHLLKLANLRLEPAPRSPFRTTVNVPPEKVAEALHWLLKGTLAVANGADAAASHLEWTCREHQGRVSLEFVLHGLECDQKSLYMNTIIDQAGSATAHFGRTERTLEGHLPVVAFRTGNRKTTVSLGLDAAAGSLTH